MASIFERAMQKEGSPTKPSSSELTEPTQIPSIFQAASSAIPEEKPQEPSTLQEAGRHAARGLSRGAETALGFFGDLRDFSQFAGEWLGEKGRKLLGKPDLSEEQKQELREHLRKESTEGPLGFLGKAAEALPTSKDIRENVTKPLTGEFLEPQSPKEKLADSFVQDTVSLFLPGPKGKAGLAKSIGIAGAANAAHEGVKSLGRSEGEQDAAKMGTLFLLSLMGRNGYRGAEKYVGEIYNKAEQAIPAGATTDATKLATNLTNLKTKMQKGTLAPSEQFVINEVDAVLAKIQNGQIPVDEAWAATRSLNEKLQEFVFKNPKQSVNARARKLADTIKNDLNETIADYGQTNPEFYKSFKDAQQGFATIAKSRQISDFIGQQAKVYGPHSLVGFIATAIHNPGLAVSTVQGGLGGGVLLKSGELMYRIGKSPVLRKHYLNVLKDAAAQDAVALHKNFEALERDAKKDPEVEALLKEIEAMRDKKS